MDDSSANNFCPPPVYFKGLMTKPRRLLLVAAVSIVVAAILLIAGLPYFFPNNPSPEVIRQKQLVVSAVILSWTDQQGIHLYQWSTTVRMLAKGGIVGMNATVSIPGMNPVSTTDFMMGLTRLAPNNPLYYNATSISASLNLSPPSQDSLHAGQSFPETLTVKYDNGTSSTLSFGVTVVTP